MSQSGIQDWVKLFARRWAKIAQGKNNPVYGIYKSTELLRVLVNNIIEDINDCNLFSIGQYECCGVHNYTDWMGIYDVNVPSSIPDSCCGYPDCGESGSMAAWRIVGLS